MTNTIQRIQSYYSPDDLLDKIKSALTVLGRDLDQVTLDDLQPVDEFHIRGQVATMELIELSGFTSGMHILDVGCGVGGSTRRLAQATSCKVTGVDLSERYISVAQSLTELVRMQDQVQFQACNALELPFADSAFDGVWSIQMNMNIHDKRAWLQELWRVLKPGSRLVLYEVCAHKNTPVYFPVPWAQDASMSCLVSADDFRELVVSSGFEIAAWIDQTDLAQLAFSQVPEPSGEPELPELGVHLLVGEDILTKAYNLRRNLDECRVSLIETVAIKN